MLLTLSKSPVKLRKAILANCSDEIIKTLAEVSANTLYGNIAVSEKDKKILKRYKKCLRDLADRKKCVKSKRKILVQKGGFLPVLLGTLLSSVVGQLLSK